jgi:phosphatidylglycerol---prolipoprotein diacylglyceryl transferase
MAQSEVHAWLGGKSVLGGFLGGTVGVEVAKKLVDWNAPTGDSWVPAIAVGLVLGRLGCQFSGTWDGTYGTPTALPWAWNYGDGIGRHPTALYEIALVIALALLVWWQPRWRQAPGARFAAFLLGYCAIRFALEFLKPPFGLDAAGSLATALHSGLSAIQWAALIGAAVYAKLLRLRLSTVNEGTH